jgi:DNA polymerase-3 subunit delta'
VLSERDGRLADITRLQAGSTRDRLAYAAELATLFGKGRDRAADVLSAWLQWWRDLLLIKCDNSRWIINMDRMAVLSKQAESLTVGSIATFMSDIRTAGQQLEQNANPRLALEMLMLRMP